jgi:hypothetical protein
MGCSIAVWYGSSPVSVAGNSFASRVPLRPLLPFVGVPALRAASRLPFLYMRNPISAHKRSPAQAEHTITIILIFKEKVRALFASATALFTEDAVGADIDSVVVV